MVFPSVRKKGSACASGTDNKIKNEVENITVIIHLFNLYIASCSKLATVNSLVQTSTSRWPFYVKEKQKVTFRDTLMIPYLRYPKIQKIIKKNYTKRSINQDRSATPGETWKNSKNGGKDFRNQSEISKTFTNQMHRIHYLSFSK